ncbi:MAG: BREX system ATP-binding domain-containing protein [Acidimicrobiales bacterium]
MIEPVASGVLVGRQAELHRLDAVMNSVARGGAEVVLIDGEAGVGKSRLLRELASRATTRGFRVAVGRCVENGEEIWPLAPLREMVASVANELDGEAFDLVVGNARAVLARLAPEVGGDDTGDAPVEGTRLCELVVGVFRRLAQRGPLLLVVDDLHWADSTTRTLFSLLARAGGLGPILLVGTYRSDELDRRHPLRPALAEVIRGARPERFELRTLDRAGTADVITAIAGVTVDSAAVDDVYRLSGGNPFFVEELVAARAAGVTGFPETLRDVVLARAATLDDTSFGVLGVVAAAGSTVPAVLADACGLDEMSLATTIDVLVAAALLVSDGEEVRFRHELARAVFYGELAPGERVRVHARLALACEALRPERPGDIARHWSTAHDLPRALTASIAAGRQALRTGAAAEAKGYFTRALELWSAVDHAQKLTGLDHAALLVETSVSARHARHVPEAIELARRAASELAGVDAMREGQIWLQLRELFRFANRWDECADAVDRALALIPASPPSAARAEALADAAIGHWFANRAAETMTLAQEAVAVAEAVGDPDAVVCARNAVGAALTLVDPAEALTYAQATLVLCGPDVSPERVLTAYNAMTNALYRCCRYAEAAAVAERGIEIARVTGLGGPRGGWLACHWIRTLVTLGHWKKAEQVAAEVEHLIELPSDQVQVARDRALALIRQGRLDEARPFVDQLRAVLQSEFWVEDLAGLGATVVEFDGAEQRYEAVADFAAGLLERSLTGLPLGARELVAVTVGALADYGQHEIIAAKLIERLEHSHESGRQPGPDDVLDLERAQAELARLRHTSDPHAWAHIADGWQSFERPYDEAYARWRAAEAHLSGTAGRANSARELAAVELTKARTIAESLGARPLLHDIDALARRARLSIVAAAPAAAPTEPEPADRFGLTAREQEVLALLTEGRSNGDIAKALFMSPKTASVHVSSILRKLGVTNRVEAAALVHREPYLR